MGEHISLIVPSDQQKELESIMSKLRGGQHIEPFETERKTKDGELVNVSLTVLSVYDGEGEIIGASAIARDITPRIQAEKTRDLAVIREHEARRAAEQKQQQMEFLLGVSEILASSLDYNTTLRNIAQLVVKHIADWCTIDLVTNGDIERVALHHMDNEKMQMAEDLRQSVTSSSSPSRTLRKVIEKGKPILFPEITETVLQEIGVEPEQFKLVARFRLESALIIPLNLGNRTLGAITLVSDTADKHFSEKDLKFMEKLTFQAALAIDHARLYQEMEHKVEQRTAELSRANQELKSFTYSVSHDLRAPLRAIVGCSDILLDERDALPDRVGVYLDKIHRNTNKMGQLIDDLLAFSRLSKRDIQETEIDTELLIEQLIEELRTEFEEVEFTLHVDDLPNSRGDWTLIKALWYNVLSNAVKYSSRQPKPTVKVDSFQKEGVDIFRVSDNGVGFDMKYAHKLFEVFQRLHRFEEYEGTGVGLAIARRVARRHGGEIWADAVPDEGATFYFTLSEEIPDD